MLVLSRKNGEEVEITRDGEIVCTVMVIRDRDHQGNVRLGFEAPPDVKIFRKEVSGRPAAKVGGR